MKRRTVVAALAGIPLAGCAIPGAGGCLLPAAQGASTPLAIDTHAHIFNASDLQVREFFAQTVLRDDSKSELYQLGRVVGGLVQDMAWTLAPSAAQELRLLEGYARCDPAMAQTLAARTAEADYRKGVAQLVAAGVRNQQSLRRPGVLGGLVEGAAVEAAIGELPPTLQEFEALQASAGGAGVLASNPTLRGFLSFLLHNFNHRHANARSYFGTYGSSKARSVDLLVPSLVDYDWWLAKGKPTDSPLVDQVQVLSRLAILTNGRIHGFVAFCPFREAMTAPAGGEGDSMKLVRAAILSGGQLGVKLYPPMGFAAWGNSKLSVWDKKPTLPRAAWEPGFGKRLDHAMKKLFDFCLAYDVPIMAHANESNGPYPAFETLAGSEHWERALKQFPGLRLSFGHFGDTDLEETEGQSRTRAFLQMMRMTEGQNVYADSGYFAGVLGHPVAMEDALKSLLREEGGLMGGRLMYGTDWMMTLAEKGVTKYLDQFVATYSQIDRAQPMGSAPLSDAFFAGNAATFLGLRRNGASRRRLEAFYGRHEIETPEWARKVDALT